MVHTGKQAKIDLTQNILQDTLLQPVWGPELAWWVPLWGGDGDAAGKPPKEAGLTGDRLQTQHQSVPFPGNLRQSQTLLPPCARYIHLHPQWRFKFFFPPLKKTSGGS